MHTDCPEVPDAARELGPELLGQRGPTDHLALRIDGAVALVLADRLRAHALSMLAGADSEGRDVRTDLAG